MPCFSTHFLYCPWFPFLSLSFQLVTSLSFFGRSSDSVASPFHSAKGSPFELSPFLFNFFALLFRYSSHTYHPFSMSTSSCFSSALLQSAVPSCYFLSSRGFSFLPPACCCLHLAFAVHTVSLFATSLAGASLRSLLLSFLLCLLPAVPHGSSILLVYLLLPPPRSRAGFHREFLYLLGSLPFALALPCSFSPPVGFPFRLSSACSSSWRRSVQSLHSSGSPPL